jgi:hypothetical protein
MSYKQNENGLFVPDDFGNESATQHQSKGIPHTSSNEPSGQDRYRAFRRPSSASQAEFNEVKTCDAKSATPAFSASLAAKEVEFQQNNIAFSCGQCDHKCSVSPRVINNVIIGLPECVCPKCGANNKLPLTVSAGQKVYLFCPTCLRLTFVAPDDAGTVISCPYGDCNVRFTVPGEQTANYKRRVAGQLIRGVLGTMAELARPTHNVPNGSGSSTEKAWACPNCGNPYSAFELAYFHNKCRRCGCRLD